GFGPGNGSDPDLTCSFCPQSRWPAVGTPDETTRDRNSRDVVMKLFVIGATGRTGEEIVQQALARGHYVTAFVRSPKAVDFRHERLGVLEGNVTNEEQLSEATQNHDAVVSALGPRRVFKPSSL